MQPGQPGQRGQERAGSPFEVHIVDLINLTGHFQDLHGPLKSKADLDYLSMGQDPGIG